MNSKSHVQFDDDMYIFECKDARTCQYLLYVLRFGEWDGVASFGLCAETLLLTFESTRRGVVPKDGLTDCWSTNSRGSQEAPYHVTPSERYCHIE
mmetsp:Transcript_24005/g.39171  ORF Transcript_24005/g.39171 Transcript_24005/m.39171 type:complete len:95 (-) Transcript_24005:1172-1456(-)